MSIDDVFDIEAWGGLVVVPGPLIGDGPARAEGPVLLKRPDGSTVSAVLKMGAMFQTPPSEEQRWGCLLKGVNKAEVPIGTEVWPAD